MRTSIERIIFYKKLIQISKFKATKIFGNKIKTLLRNQIQAVVTNLKKHNLSIFINCNANLKNAI